MRHIGLPMGQFARVTAVYNIIFLLAAIGLWQTGCTQTPEATTPALPILPTATLTSILPTATAAPPATNAPAAAPTSAAVTPTETPFFTGAVEPCGQILPILSPSTVSPVTTLNRDAAALARLQEIVPEAAQPALNKILQAPENVGLAAYRVGQEADGAYLNADAPMPLASVVKVIHLVAYAEAVAAGQLEPTSTVTLEELAAYYLPTTDLGAHLDAIAALEENGRLFGAPPTLLLDEVPGMMIEFSSNAATDYLHMLLGQGVIEKTAVSLELPTQTAPCPFVGQFLIMGNHVQQRTNDYNAVDTYIADPARYGRDVMLFTQAFSSDPDFRQTAIEWRQTTRRPTGQTQRFFSDMLNAQGSARDYAALMARIAQNGLSSGDSSFTARRFLEWPMRFADNQAVFTNLGYKGGNLPGVLTTVYYAYPRGETTPIVVALFYRDLDGRSYREWRNTQAHDELARWLLYDPEAIAALRDVLTPANAE